MKIRTLIFVGIAAILCACNSSSSNTPATVSSDATVRSLTFVANNDYPTLSKTVFAVEDRIDTGLIYNVDSIAYGIPIDSVVPSFRFNATPGAAVIYTPTDTIALTGSDTVDFSVRPVLLHVIASDYVSDKWYKVEVNVHQVDPELYVWEEVNQSVYDAAGTEQKMIYHEGQLKWFVNDGIQNRLFVSSNNGKGWTENGITGLPKNCRVRNILEAKGNLYYCQENSLFVSNNGLIWTESNHSADKFQFVNMLCVFNDSVWSIVRREQDGVYCFASSYEGEAWNLRGSIPDDFPISDFGVL